MSGFRALVWLDILTSVRDRPMRWFSVVTALLSGLVAPMAARLPLDEPPEGAAAEGETGGCDADQLPSLSAEGVWPDWLDWVEPLVDPGDAEVVAEVRDADGIVEITLSGAGPKEDVDEVERCLELAIQDAQRARVAALGLSIDPVQPVEVHLAVDLPPKKKGSRARFSALGTLSALIAVLVAGSIAIEAVPRRRGTGLLEQLRSTPTREGELVAAWVTATTLLTAFVLGPSAVCYLVGAAWVGSVGPSWPAWHAIPFAALVAAATIRTSLTATDVQAATLRWFAVLLALVLGSAAVYGCTKLGYAFAVLLVPFGGSMLVTAIDFGWRAGLLADLAALGWTVLLIAWSARSLAAEESTTAGVDAALHRRARGNYLPEVLVLVAFGATGGVVAGGAVFGGQVWVGATFAFVGFMLLPAVLAGPVLGLPRAELLPLGPPRARDLALVVPLAGGLGVLAQLVVTGTMAVFPTNDLVDAFLKSMAELPLGPYGVFALAVYPAVCEELLFRGAIFGLLLRSGRPWLALVAQALAFSLVHVVSIRLPWTFLFGLATGWLRLRTGSLWAGMWLHLLNNLGFSLLMALDWVDPDATVPLAALPLLVLLLVLPWIGRRADGEP